ncbi:MAG: mechanosensitive ion channel family protein [Chloroflexi bacterium]|nr:mechanosensitive ion channel family protein [Chloroflexota bacterium]
MSDVFDLSFELSGVITSAITILAVIVVAFMLARLATRSVHMMVKRRMELISDMPETDRSQRADTVGGTLAKFARLAIWAVAGMTILAEFGINVAPIVTGLGIGGLAIAFAAQNIIRDYLHGFLIVIEDWYRVGEVAQLAGNAGLVTSLNLRTTTLRDGDGALYVIPNGQITSAKNMTREFARINFNIEVGYGEDLDHAIEVINDECELFKADPAWSEQLLTTPRAVRVDNLGASGIELKVMGDTQPMSRVPAMGELKKRLKKRFDVEGIEIPWPHTKVYFGDGVPKPTEAA